MSLPRFHVPSVATGRTELPEAAGRHATRVLRLRVGDALRVFDGGAEFSATIAEIQKHRLLIDVGASLPAPPERAVSLHLIMSALKGDLTELVIQKATELGVARISPVIFERTDTVARREPTDARLERWRRVAAGAAEQSGRAVVPLVDRVDSLEPVAVALGRKPVEQIRIVAVEPSIEGEPVAATAHSSIRSVLIAVGPAGGLAPRDLEILEGAGFSRERFALHTLRAETACLAALAILGHRFSAA